MGTTVCWHQRTSDFSINCIPVTRFWGDCQFICPPVFLFFLVFDKQVEPMDVCLQITNTWFIVHCEVNFMIAFWILLRGRSWKIGKVSFPFDFFALRLLTHTFTRLWTKPIEFQRVCTCLLIVTIIRKTPNPTWEWLSVKHIETHQMYRNAPCCQLFCHLALVFSGKCYFKHLGAIFSFNL